MSGKNHLEVVTQTLGEIREVKPKNKSGRMAFRCPYCRNSTAIEQHIMPEEDGRRIYTNKQRFLRCDKCLRVVAEYERSGVWAKIKTVQD